MTYNDTIEYLYNRLPMFSRIGEAAIKKDLHNTIVLCNSINNPQHNFKTIHIAGTNGKGSTSHMLASILQQAGYKTGLYTSPHLKDFRERIKINGEFISKNFVTNFVKKTDAITNEIEPSFFELTVAMAFSYFAQQKVDIAVIETGLGGRLDSTNIINPILSIITNIGFDHTNILGNTIEEIATEKAGIIKRNTPIIIGEAIAKTKPIFTATAKKLQAPITFAQKTYEIENISSSVDKLSLTIKNTNTNRSDKFVLDLPALYQSKNVLSVLCAVDALKQQGFSISNKQTKDALKNVKKISGLHGRWDVVSKKPTIVLDVAHNKEGITEILTQLKTLGYQWQQVHFVMGMVKDKNIDAALSVLPKKSNYYFANAHIPRALEASILLEQAAKHQLKGKCFDNVNDAIKDAQKNIAPVDIIIVCGSVFLISEVDTTLFTK